jgi:ATP-dependent helicase/nuclease subunit A
MTEPRDQMLIDFDTPASESEPRQASKPSQASESEPSRAHEPRQEGEQPSEERELEPNVERGAILSFETDLVVAAGAGSGKTRALVDLYIEILEKPELVGLDDGEIGPGRILCLTFTERAAREIQARIRRRVDRPAWLRELETAPILTFHAWCARLLRDYPMEVGVDPRFSVMTEEMAVDLLRRVAVETLRRGLEAGDVPARRVVETHGLLGASGHLVDLVARIRTAGWPPLGPVARFEKRIAEAGAEADGHLRATLDEATEKLVAAIRPGARTIKARGALADLERAFGAWRDEPSLDRGCALGRAIKDTRGDPPAREAALSAFDSWSSARLESDRARDLGVWPALALTIRAEYRAARQARGALDYDDLLLRTRELLTTHEEIRRAYRRRYRALLVDEHQDTDPVQHEILSLLVGADSLAGLRTHGDPRWCVVGDVQQAIYGFRGASVVEFAALVEGARERRALRRLAVNYRSRNELVAFYNRFFPRVLTAGPDPEAVGYTPQEALRPPVGSIAVEIIAPGAERSAAEGRELEARALAARLAAALDPGDPSAVSVLDVETKTWRQARPGDVAILFRRLTQIEPYRRALQSAGLEPVVVGTGEFYARQEVFDILNALEAAILPEDPIPLVGFLRSPMVGLPDDAAWRLTREWDRRGGMLRDHMSRAAATTDLEPEERTRLDEALGLLDELRSRADREPPGALLTWLVDRTGYAAVLDALPDRAQRRANLARLMTLADRAPSDGAPLLADWVAMLRSRADRPPRDRDAPLPQPADRVTILSIHQAKGLEFPIVALADIGGTAREGLGGVAFDPLLGVVSKWWEDGGAKGVATRSYELAKQVARHRERAEEARLLYVAATRARDHLILSAGSRGPRPGWWLSATLEFLACDGAAELVTALPLEDWAQRGGAWPRAIEAPTSGEPYREALATAPGEVAARDLAAVMAERRMAVLPAEARDAARLRMRRGDRAHRALERLPLSPPEGFDLRSWLSDAGVEAEDLETVAGFVEREAWTRLGEAVEVHREVPFRLHLPDPGGIVVGAIDLLWRDTSGDWWVWDYKLVSDDGPSAQHEAQLEIYALAAATALGIDRLRGALWYLGRGSSELRWDRAALLDARSRFANAFPRAVPEPVYLIDSPRPAADRSDDSLHR